MLELKQNRLDAATALIENYQSFTVFSRRVLDSMCAVELSASPIETDGPSVSDSSSETAVELECLPSRGKDVASKSEEKSEFIDPSFEATEEQKESLARTWNLVKEPSPSPETNLTEVIEMQSWRSINYLMI
jgi:hypothetical protein